MSDLICMDCGAAFSRREHGSGRQRTRCERCRVVALASRWGPGAVPRGSITCADCGKPLRGSVRKPQGEARCVTCTGGGVRQCETCGVQCRGKRCRPCREADRAKRDAEWLAEARERAIQGSMDAAFAGVLMLARSIDATTIPRALTLILDAAVHDLEPWMCHDGDVVARAAQLTALADLIAANMEVGRRESESLEPA